MSDTKVNYLLTLVFDENSDIRKQVDTEHAVKTYIRNGLRHAIAGKEIKHFIIADDEVINEKLTQERKVGKWILSRQGIYTCSICGLDVSASEVNHQGYVYCPKCGNRLER